MRAIRRWVKGPGQFNRLENEMNSMYEWIGIYCQYRRAGHRVSYAAQIATGIVFHGLPF